MRMTLKRQIRAFLDVRQESSLTKEQQDEEFNRRFFSGRKFSFDDFPTDPTDMELFKRDIQVVQALCSVIKDKARTEGRRLKADKAAGEIRTANRRIEKATS
jgi:hypothetical protein